MLRTVTLGNCYCAMVCCKLNLMVMSDFITTESADFILEYCEPDDNHNTTSRSFTIDELIGNSNDFKVLKVNGLIKTSNSFKLLKYVEFNIEIYVG